MPRTLKAKVEQSERFRSQSGSHNIKGGRFTRASAGVLLMAVTMIVPITVSASAGAGSPAGAKVEAAHRATATINPAKLAAKAFGVPVRHRSKAHAEVRKPAATHDPGLDFLEVLSVVHNNPFLTCVRGIESRNTYGIDTGNGYYGAYQFKQSTWNNTVAHMGWLQYYGVSPSSSSSVTQDFVAWTLYCWQGTAPWAGDAPRCP